MTHGTIMEILEKSVSHISTSRVRVALLASFLMILPAALAGCGGDEADGSVSISLLFTPGQSFESLGVQTVTVYPTGPGISSSLKRSFPVASKKASLPMVPHGINRRIVVEGYSATKLEAKGTSAPFNLQPGDSYTARVMMAKPDAFAKTIEFDSNRNTYLSQGRVGHGVVSLPDGKILVIGGAVPQTANAEAYQSTLNSISIYDPQTGRWIESQNGLNEARAFHTVTRMPGKQGYILVTGGISVMGGVTSTLASTELIIPSPDVLRIESSKNPNSGISPLTEPRAYHSANLLDDGSVLVAGGAVVNSSGISDYLNTAGIFTFMPPGVTYTPVQPMTSKRAFHSGVASGTRVLIAGGRDAQGPIDGTEFYISNQKLFMNASPLQKARSHFALLLHQNKDILVIGGRGRDMETPGIEMLSTNSLGQLVFKELQPGSALAQACARADLSATELLTGEILVTGGAASSDAATALNTGFIISQNIVSLAQQDPMGTHFRSVQGMEKPRRLHQSILLDNGNVLVTGGMTTSSVSSTTTTPTDTEIFTAGADPTQQFVPEEEEQNEENTWSNDTGTTEDYY